MIRNSTRTIPLFISFPIGLIFLFCTIFYLIREHDHTNRTDAPESVTPSASKEEIKAAEKEWDETTERELESEGKMNIGNAAWVEDWDRMKQLIQEKPSTINDGNENSDPALISTCMSDNIDMTIYLLKHNADVNAKNKAGDTALHSARSAEMVNLLIANGANVNAKENDIGLGAGYTPLLSASALGEVDVVKALLDNGADVNAKSSNGMTPLHLALNLAIAKLLVEHGANVDAVADQQNLTPIDRASSLNRMDIVEYLRSVRNAKH